MKKKKKTCSRHSDNKTERDSSRRRDISAAALKTKEVLVESPMIINYSQLRKKNLNFPRSFKLGHSFYFTWNVSINQKYL